MIKRIIFGIGIVGFVLSIGLLFAYVFGFFHSFNLFHINPDYILSALLFSLGLSFLSSGLINIEEGNEESPYYSEIMHRKKKTIFSRIRLFLKFIIGIASAAAAIMVILGIKS